MTAAPRTAPPSDAPRASGPTFTVQEIPFSRQGSWLAVSPVTALATYADDLHLMTHTTGMHPVLRLTPVNGSTRAETQITATPAVLTWAQGDGQVQAVFATTDTVRLRGDRLGLRLSVAADRLTPFTGAYLYADPVGGGFVLTSYETGRRYRITVLAGTVHAEGLQELGEVRRALTVGADGRPWEIALEEYEAARPPYRSDQPFDLLALESAASFRAFADAVAPWRDATTPAAELAAYVLWSATVRPAGFLGRPGVLMSKHWMDKVWSWDHCFNALALAAGAPDLAYDQFQVMFDHQDSSGALPDSVTHSEVLYNYVKPPIHGWAFGLLRRRMSRELTRRELSETYDRLGRWSRFWLDSRRAAGSPLPHYQHGNDSGWDNATAFDPERVIETADLSAFLVLQLRRLADLAAELGLPAEAAEWTATADQLSTDLFALLWRDDHFHARGVVSGDDWHTDGLLDLMPIILGQELPAVVADALAARIAAHLTEFGLATELTGSPHYHPDGYWRGPIWAPATILIEDGLRRAGHTALADEISARFRALCERSGFAENFDALTGAGLRDRAYTWTASAYLLLASAHLDRTGRAKE
ncbi:amylo-alpha-1,6-glucosidase [Actinocorallia populi]|uniref:amylo-alpha-1,6-glucosidase n=1 Tax=Actinocorallia populi TaxID=2079200 RepID=UPI000D09407E|nr:trehalase family glycosidase [Actinocorallia populi]